jgi:hypothetical protein
VEPVHPDPAGRAIPDIGALLAGALARPVAWLTGSTPKQVRAEVTARPDTARAAGLSALTRFIAWLVAAVFFLVPGLVAIVVENIINGPPAHITPRFVLPVLSLCVVTAVLSSIRAGIAWYVTPERWARAGPVLRWLVTPGNRDLYLALVLVGLVTLAVLTD